MSPNATPLPGRREPARQTTSLDGRIEICAEEGIAVERYRDSVWVWTIGTGITAAAGSDINPENYTGRITMRHALDMMVDVLPDYERIVHELLGPISVPQTVFDALVCAAWNIGPAFGRGVNTRRLVRAGQYRDALIQWNKAGGRVSQALLQRRHREADLAEYGYYTTLPIPIYDGQGPGNRPRRIGEIYPEDLKAMMQPKRPTS